MEVGRISAKLEAVFDDRGFDTFDRALRGARDDARRPVEAELRADYDGTDFDQFERNLRDARGDSRRPVEAELRGDFDGRAFKKYDRAVGDADKSSGRLGRAMGGAAGAAKLAGAGMVAGSAGAAFLGKTFVDSASDINESLTKNQVLFGGHAKALDRWSQDTAKSIGVSRKSALEATGTFGNLFTALGIGQQKSAGMSRKLVELAADMASFNNSSPEEALEAIRSGLVGETEPLRRFGVNMNDATLKAQAMKMGLIDSTKEALDPQTKALAANSLITKQTASAHGDFHRTSGGLANQIRILKASVSDTGAELGEKLLPVVTKVVNGLNDLIGGGKGAGGALSGLKRVGENVGDAFSSIAKGIGGFVAENRDTIDSIGHSLGGLWTSVKRILGGIAKAFSDTFSNKGMGGDLRNIGGKILDFYDVVYKVFNAIARRVVPAVVTIFKGFAEVIRGVVRVISGILSGDFGKAWEGVKDIFRGAVKVTLGILRATTAPLREVASKIGEAISKPFEAAFGLVKSAARTMARVVGAAFHGLRDAVKFVIGKILDGIDFFLSGLESMARAASHLPFIGDKFKGVADRIHGTREKLQGLKDELDGTPGKASKVDALLNAFKNLRDRVNDVGTAIDNVFGKIGKNVKIGGGKHPHIGVDIEAIGFKARGGRIDQPTMITGEEAPRYPEFVVSTNPRDRPRMLDLFYEIAGYLGIPALKKGSTPAKKPPPPQPKPAAKKPPAPKPASQPKPAASTAAKKPAPKKPAAPKKPTAPKVAGDEHSADTLAEQIAEARLWVTKSEGGPNETAAHAALRTLLLKEQAQVNAALKSTAKKYKNAPKVKKQTTKALNTVLADKKKLESKLDKARAALAKTGTRKPTLKAKRAKAVKKLEHAVGAKAKKADNLRDKRATLGNRDFLEDKRVNLIGDLDAVTGEIKGEQSAIDAIAEEKAAKEEEASMQNWTLDNWLAMIGEKANVDAARADITRAVASGDETAMRTAQGKLAGALGRAWQVLSNDKSGVVSQEVLDELAGELSNAKEAGKAPEPSEDVLDYLSAEERTTYDALVKDQQSAEASAATDDDLAVAQRAVTFWQGVWDRLQGDATLPSDVRGSIASALSGARSDVESVAGGSPVDIAAAANAQLQGFQAARAELFGGFGSNFVAAGSSAFADQTQQAAGLKFYGAAPGAGALTPVGTSGAGGAQTVTVVQNYQEPPKDPLTWSKSMEYELRAAL